MSRLPRFSHATLDEVSEGRVFPSFYLREIDATLEALNQETGQ